MTKSLNQNSYHWTAKDKSLYALSMIPFIALFVGTLYILSGYPVFIAAGWIILYLIVNVFQAGCCVGCPYRGKYCPAFVGVYLGNLLSGIIYKNREYDAKFFERNAAGGEITLTLFFLFPLYWLFISNWGYVPIYLGLVVLHIILFMPTQCPKCSYNETCPGGKAYQNYRKLFRK